MEVQFAAFNSLEYPEIKAGIDKVVIIIRKEIEADFQERIGERIGRLCNRKGIELHFAYQSLQDIPIPPVPERKKPWGTGQAVLAAKEFLTEPFVVINADDYYGKQAFRMAAQGIRRGPRRRQHTWYC